MKIILLFFYILLVFSNDCVDRLQTCVAGKDYFENIKFDSHNYVVVTKYNSYIHVNITHPGGRNPFYPNPIVYEYNFVRCGCADPTGYLLYYILVLLVQLFMYLLKIWVQLY